jgi:hypothetical protein
MEFKMLEVLDVEKDNKKLGTEAAERFFASFKMNG